MSKLRVLCLHGFTSNGTVHAVQVRKITKQLSSDFEFVFPDGPHEVPMRTSNNAETNAWISYVSSNSTIGHRAWWFANVKTGRLRGLEKSLEHIGQIMEKSGPFHAVWGFSQGGILAGMLMSLLHEQQQDHPMRQYFPKQQALPRAGVFFSGFKARFPQYDSIYQQGIQMPTLHIMGVEDKLVTIAMSETLLGVCTHARVLKHTGGHDIPSAQEDQAIVVEFLRQSVGSRTSESL